MPIHLIATGKLKDPHYLAAEAEYHKRLVAPWQVSITELATAPTPAQEAALQTAAIAKLPLKTQILLLDEHAPPCTSPALSTRLLKYLETGPLALLIGGASGFCPQFKKAHPQHLGLGLLTLPHQLVRVVLAEQLYRAQTIALGHPYHRGQPGA